MTIKRNSETDYTIKITREEIKAIEDGLFYAWMNFLDKKADWEEREGRWQLEWYTEKIKESYSLYKQFAEEKNQKVN